MDIINILKEAKDKIKKEDIDELYDVTYHMLLETHKKDSLSWIDDLYKGLNLNDMKLDSKYCFTFNSWSITSINAMNFIALRYEDLNMEAINELYFQITRLANPSHVIMSIKVFCECLERNKNLPDDVKLWVEMQ